MTLVRILVLAVVLAAGAAGCVPAPAPTAVPATTTPVPPATPSLVVTGPLRWTLTPVPAAFSSYDVYGVIRRSDGGFSAIASSGRENDLRILTSPDGRLWTLQPADPGLVETPALHVNLVTGFAQGRNGLVAVGAVALDDYSSGDARSWTAADGLHWTRGAADAGLRDASMEAVVAGPAGFIAVGSDGYPGANTQLPGARGVAAWASTDGAGWTRVGGQASFADSIMRGVVRTDDGYAAWGENIPGARAAGDPVWTSADGVTWARGTIRGVQGTFLPIRQIVVTTDRLVAVGAAPALAEGPDVAAAWTSTDGGATWDRAAVDALPRDTEGQMDGVATDGSSLLGVGRAQSSTADQGQAVAWRSVDGGLTWSRVPDEPSFAAALMREIVATPTGFTVFGQTDDPNALEEPPLIWLVGP